MKKMKTWSFAALIAALAAAAAVLRFALRGYAYLAYALLFVAALLLLYRFCSPALWRIIAVLVCIGFAYFCFVEALVLHDSRTDAPDSLDYIIVLGSAVYGDKPSGTMNNRVIGAVQYLEQNPDTMVIVSGGRGDGEEISEAQCMHDLLVYYGIEDSRILMEDQSTSTMENLTNSFAIIRSRGDDPDGRVAVVSSSYHLYRAKQMAARMGVKAYGIKGRFGFFPVMVNFYIREAFGVTHLWIFGN